MNRGIIRSAHDISDGGLAVALAESAFAGGLGVTVNLSPLPRTGVYRDDFLLFSESQSRFVLSISKASREAFERLFRGLAYAIIGEVREDARFLVRGLQGNLVIDGDIAKLKEAWRSPFTRLFG